MTSGGRGTRFDTSGSAGSCAPGGGFGDAGRVGTTGVSGRVAGSSGESVSARADSATGSGVGAEDGNSTNAASAATATTPAISTHGGPLLPVLVSWTTSARRDFFFEPTKASYRKNRQTRPLAGVPEGTIQSTRARCRFCDRGILMAHRKNLVLLTGGCIALVMVFRQPILALVQLGLDIEARYGLAVVPGIVAIAAAWVGHYALQRAHATSARQLAAETSHLVTLGHGLTQAAGIGQMRDYLRQHLQDVAGSEGVWALLRPRGGKWESLTGAPLGGSVEAGPANVRRAEELYARGQADLDAASGHEIDGHLCFPLICGDGHVGVLGAPVPPDDRIDDLRRRLAVIGTLTGITIRNMQLLAEIEEHGVYDGLTRCFNRTHGMKLLDAELQRAKRARTDFSIVMFDLDFFKSVNDEHGHLCGDALLAAVGKRLTTLFRNSDIRVRYGGEEFMILLPDTNLDGAAIVAEIARKEIGAVSVDWRGQLVSRTASAGVAAARKGELDSNDTIARADAALYLAKETGRNRVCVDGRSATDEQPADEDAAPEGVAVAAWRGAHTRAAS